MKKQNDLTMVASEAADKLMHSALHLAGKHVWDDDFDYQDPMVWHSDDPAVVLLIERYRLLVEFLEWSYMVMDL